MKPSLLTVAFFAACVPASAATTLFRVLPGDFADWSVSTLSGKPLADNPSLAIPAETQVSRKFGLRALVLRSVSQPVFSATAANWPILEVGEVALVVARTADVGRLVLVLGDKTVVSLAEDIPLESDGSARLEVILGYDPVSSTAVVSWGDQTKSFVCPRSSQASIEVNLTAGSEDAWPQSALDILVLDPEADTPTIAAGGARTGTNDPSRLSAAIDRLKSSSDGSAGQALASIGAITRPDNSAGVAVKATPLEIFTPPSVRQARANALRAAAAQIQR
jgi:hypothetical protein